MVVRSTCKEFSEYPWDIWVLGFGWTIGTPRLITAALGCSCCAYFCQLFLIIQLLPMNTMAAPLGETWRTLSQCTDVQASITTIFEIQMHRRSTSDKSGTNLQARASHHTNDATSLPEEKTPCKGIHLHPHTQNTIFPQTSELRTVQGHLAPQMNHHFSFLMPRIMFMNFSKSILPTSSSLVSAKFPKTSSLLILPLSFRSKSLKATQQTSSSARTLSFQVAAMNFVKSTTPLPSGSMSWRGRKTSHWGQVMRSNQEMFDQRWSAAIRFMSQSNECNRHPRVTQPFGQNCPQSRQALSCT